MQARPTIRQMLPEDAQAVAKMWNESDSVWPGSFTHGVPFTAEIMRQWLEERREINTYIAFVGDEAAGYCRLTPKGDNPKAAYVALLSAHPAYHGQGIGRDLLKKALERTIELGFERVDLHTWAGNMRAIPLYKKSGYFWAPESSVFMVNYLPLVLKQSYVRDFLDERDWYTHFVRDLSVKPDDITIDGRRVYPYEFRREVKAGNSRAEERMRVLIDPSTDAITAIETPRLTFSCTPAESPATIGATTSLKWRVERRDGSDLPGQITLVARGSGAAEITVNEQAEIRDRFELTRELKPSASGNEGAPVISTTLLLKGDGGKSESYSLLTGLKLEKAIDLQLENSPLRLTPGVPGALPLVIRSNLNKECKVSLRLAAPSGVSIEPAQFETTLAPKGGVAFAPTVLIQSEGATQISSTLVFKAEGISAKPSQQAFSVHTVDTGVVYSDEGGSIVVTTPELRVGISKRGSGGGISLGESGALLAEGDVRLGPPYGAIDLECGQYATKVEPLESGGGIRVSLRGTSDQHPGLVFERIFDITPGRAIRIHHRLSNTGAQSVAYNLETVWRTPHEAARWAIPTKDGVVLADSLSFPDWSDPALQSGESFGEGWIARQYDDRVVGWVWKKAESVNFSGWQVPTIILPGVSLGPGESYDYPAFWLVGGHGDWRQVRAFWARRLSPESLQSQPNIIEEFSAGLDPVALTDDKATLRLETVRLALLNGRIEIESPDNLEVDPESFAVEGWRLGQPIVKPLTIRFPADRAGAWSGRVRGSAGNWGIDLPLPLIKLGRNGNSPTVGEKDGLVTVDNGRLVYRVAPGFCGAVVSLADERGEHLHSPYPNEKPFLDFNPWFGGVTPRLQESDDWHGEYPYACRSYDWGRAERVGLFGKVWSGVRLVGAPADKRLGGARHIVEYLTLPESNTVLLLSQIDPGGLPVRPSHGFTLFPAPGGPPESTVLRFETLGQERSHARQTDVYPVAERWSCFENSNTGDCLSLVGNPKSSRLFVHCEGQDWVGATGRTLPGSTGFKAALQSVYLIALTRSLDEARLYRSLAKGLVVGPNQI